MTVRACGVTPELLAYLKGYAQAMDDAAAIAAGFPVVEQLKAKAARMREAFDKPARNRLDMLHDFEKIAIPEDL